MELSAAPEYVRTSPATRRPAIPSPASPASRFLCFNAGHITQALHSGVLGYLTKYSEAGDVIDGIRRVATGKRVFSPEIAQVQAEEELDGDGALAPPTPSPSARPTPVSWFPGYCRRSKWQRPSLSAQPSGVSEHEQTSLVGLNVLDSVDAAGTPLFRHMIAVTDKQTEARIRYVWLNRKTNHVEPKNAWLYRQGLCTRTA